MCEANNNLLACGHRACPGCTVPIIVNKVLEVTGRNVVVVTATGCLETFTSPFDLSSWQVPWIHPLFENAAAVATGVLAALEAKGNKENTKVVAFGGDGSTYDIGIGALSGMFERGDNVLYICYDNEAYMNTGVQRSSSTPFGATTTTSPKGDVSFGNNKNKKDMPAIALAHGVKYVASASISNLKDLETKVKKALEVDGPAYLQILAPCNIGWGFPSELAIEIGRLMVKTALFPLFEYTDGILTDVKKVPKKLPVEDVLFLQKRFKHLKKAEEKEQVEKIQALADRNIEKFNL